MSAFQSLATVVTTPAMLEFGELFHVMTQRWHAHPNHYGCLSFGDFVNKLPLYYQMLIVQQAPPQPQASSRSSSSQTTTTTKHNKSNAVKHLKIPLLDTVEEEKEFEAMSPSPSLSACSSSSSSPSNLNLNAFAPVFVPDESDNPTGQQSQPLFIPKHAARAKFNIYIPKHMTKTLLANIAESFPNANALYYYLDISTAMQINDAQLKMTQLSDGRQVVLVHYDLHCKRTREWLYAVVTQNDAHKIEVDTQKWLWKIDEFLTAPQILSKYAIDAHQLPKSSRSTTPQQHALYRQLRTQLAALDGLNDLRLLTEVKWSENSVTQIASSQKWKKTKKTAASQMDVAMSTLQWIQSCVNSWHRMPAIPIVVYENQDKNAHWIEWVKMVHVESAQRYLGVSFRYVDSQWQITSVCLDKNDVHNKHRLVCLQSSDDMSSLHATYDAYFDQFETGITSVRWY